MAAQTKRWRCRHEAAALLSVLVWQKIEAGKNKQTSSSDKQLEITQIFVYFKA